jgi:hypothetical protein
MSARLLRLGVAVIALAPACHAAPATSTRCQRDDQCDVTSACVAGTCLTRLTPPASWAVEIAPTSTGAAAYTELPHVDLSMSTLALAATARATVTGTLTLDAAVARLTSAHVLLTVPAGIPGRPDLLYEIDLPPGGDAAMPTFSLPVPSGIMGRLGTLTILPSSPDDLTHAPSVFTLAVAPTMAATITARTLIVRGRLLSALGDPRSGFVARAYLGDELVSDVATTDADGAFTLMVPADRLGPADEISVRLTPVATDTVDPRYSTKAFSLTMDTDLGDLQLPAFGQPNTFRLFAHGDTADGPVVANALVRTYNAVSDDLGTTDFLRDGLTNAAGYTDLALLPGTTAALRTYTIAVVTPAGSPYATGCFTAFPLASGGSPSAPANVPAFVLQRRVVVSGTVRGDDGTPAAGVLLTATPAASVPSVPPWPCATIAQTPASTTTTDLGGAYQIYLDAGSYRLDFDPPEGSPVPRLTEAAVDVAASTTADEAMSHDVQLPPGALLEGAVAGPDGLPLPLAGVRFYGTCSTAAMCQDAVPVLQADVHTDATGNFRAVIPTSARP